MLELTTFWLGLAFLRTDIVGVELSYNNFASAFIFPDFQPQEFFIRNIVESDYNGV